MKAIEKVEYSRQWARTSPPPLTYKYIVSISSHRKKKQYLREKGRVGQIYRGSAELYQFKSMDHVFVSAFLHKFGAAWDSKGAYNSRKCR